MASSELRVNKRRKEGAVLPATSIEEERKHLITEAKLRIVGNIV